MIDTGVHDSTSGSWLWPWLGLAWSACCAGCAVLYVLCETGSGRLPVNCMNTLYVYKFITCITWDAFAMDQCLKWDGEGRKEREKRREREREREGGREGGRERVVDR